MKKILLIAAIAGMALTGCKKKEEKLTEVTLVSIEVTKQPNKRYYIVDDPFDPAGMVVTASYSDKSSKPITVTSAMLSGFDSATPGQKTVNVTYSEKGVTKTATVTGITVTAPEVTLVSIVVTTQPTKKEYLVGEEFDATGMVVTATYSNETTEIVPLDELEFDYNFASAGTDKTVTITYEGKTAMVDGITVNVSHFSGNGSLDTPYLISNAADLNKLSELINLGNETYAAETVYYQLENSFTMPAGDFTPIGASGISFKGNFDGNGKIIAGLTINTTSSYAGLFGIVIGGKISNLGLANVSITSGSNYTGGVAGYITGSGANITGCYVSGTVNGTSNVGGVVGYVNGVSVTNCYSTATVEGNDNIGGVVGNAIGGSVTNCYAAGVVSGSRVVGGVAGTVDNSSLTNCAALNPSVERLSGTETSFGRVIGSLYIGLPTNNVALDDMQALGDITFGASTYLNGEDITPAQSKQRATYEALGWDFTTFWEIDEGVSYPKLMWE